MQNSNPTDSPKGINTNGKQRENVKPGLHVFIVQKQGQRTEELTEGYIEDILTNSFTHPRGIKVRLETGEVGRVKIIP